MSRFCPKLCLFVVEVDISSCNSAPCISHRHCQASMALVDCVNQAKVPPMKSLVPLTEHERGTDIFCSVADKESWICVLISRARVRLRNHIVSVQLPNNARP
jgi:hypothetical protein